MQMAVIRPSKEELARTLRLHRAWLDGDADLSNADLSNADLRWADLSNADLRWADLSNADLSNADLSNADLRWADLSNADLSNADLRWADLRWADLSNADLSNADLRWADLSGARDMSPLALAQTEIVPREGSFVGWKACRDGLLVKLRVTEGARRSNATGRKCRCSEAEVLEITDRDGGHHDEATSLHDERFAYRVGETVRVDGFDEDRLQECAAGIHFFLTPEEAWDY
jgi:uncharacterized protein YjbI with pentapeptide repeats